LFVNFKFT